MSTKVSSTAKKNLQEGNLDSPTLPNIQSGYLYSIFENILWITKRAQLSIGTTVSFLCTLVKSPTEKDKNKLKILLHFQNQTTDDRRVIGAESISDLLNWIDSSYTFHPDMKSRNGVAMSLGQGLIHCTP